VGHARVSEAIARFGSVRVSSAFSSVGARFYGGCVHLRYAYRLNPTPGQRIALSRAFGCARVVFNDAVAARKAAHEAGRPYPTDAALSAALTLAKRTPERVWLAEVSSVVLQQALADANTAYRNFFASLAGKRRGRRLGAPRFRSKRDRAQSIRFTKAARFTVTHSGRLRLPRIGDVPIQWSRDLPAEPSSVTVTVDPAGRYHASFVVEVDDDLLSPTRQEIGVDLGLTHFAVLSDGRKVANPRFARKAAAKLRRAQKELSRRQRGSKNRAKSRLKVAGLYVRVSDTRRDWLHKLSTTLIRENQAVYVEDLAVSALARTRLARSVHDAGWTMFVAMLEYKARRHGRTFSKVDRWLPSTRTCSACGAVGDAKPLNVRHWVCPCGAVHDRDINAAINILAAGRAESTKTPVELVSDGTSVAQPAVKQEPVESTA
jgi:putative transposase